MSAPLTPNASTWASTAAILFLLLGATSVRAQTFLQIIHSSDNESSFQDPNTLEEKVLFYSALVNGLQQLAAAESIPSLHVTAGDHTIPGPFYEASAEVAAYGEPGLADIDIYNAFPNVGNGMGNHEFDGGIDEFAHMINAANYPFLAVNMDFTSVTTDPAIVVGEDAGPCTEVAGQVTKSCYLVVGEGNTTLAVGLIGRAPADFFNVVEDPDTTLPGLDFVGGRDPATNQPLESAVPMVLEQVALLEAQNVSIIILLDHAQDFTGDPLSAELLRGIDIVVSAGSSGFMASDTAIGPFDFLREGDVGNAVYPTELTDSEGKTVLIVNSDQLYNYVGHLIVEFNDMGEVVSFDDERSGPIATTAEGVALLAEELEVDTLDPMDQVSMALEMLQSTDSIVESFEEIGNTTVFLDGERANVRTMETNLARVVADSTLWGGEEYSLDNDFPAVDIALKNGGGIRDSIAGPTIIRLTVRAALAFDNKLTLIELTGSQLIAAMENGVSRVPAVDGRFPQVAGMTMVYDESKEGMEGLETLDTPSRIETLVIMRANGTEDTLIADYMAVGDLNRTFIMATNSFLIGGDGYNSLPGATVIGETDLGEQLILENYIVNVLNGTVSVENPPPEPRVSKVEGPAAPPTDTDTSTMAPVASPMESAAATAMTGSMMISMMIITAVIVAA